MSISACENWEPSKILHAIISTKFDIESHRLHAGYKAYTYVICGRPGPTGKSWLYYNLLERGFRVIELSEDMAGLIEYNDDKNHVIINGMNKSVLIVLNKPLKEIERENKR